MCDHRRNKRACRLLASLIRTSCDANAGLRGCKRTLQRGRNRAALADRRAGRRQPAVGTVDASAADFAAQAAMVSMAQEHRLHRVAAHLRAARVALVSPVAPARREGVVADKSEIRFVTKQMGVNFEGSFRKWKSNIVFLPENLAKSKAEFDIELASIDLQSDDSDSEVKGPLWFDMGKFPVAHFASTSMKSVGPDKFEIVGPLTMKGVTRNVVVPIALKKDNAGNRVAEGAFVVKR